MWILRIREFIFHFVFCACGSVGIGVTLGFDAIQAEEVPQVAVISESAKKALELMQAAHAELRSGVFHAVGYHVITHRDGRPAIQYPSMVTCHFDFRNGCWRYETRDTKVMGVNSFADLTPEVVQQIKDKTFQSNNARPRNAIAMLARTPEYMVEWHSYGEREEPDHATSHVEIRKPDVRPDTFMLHPFSPESCGLFDSTGFEQGWGISEILKYYASRADSVDSEVDESGQVRVVYFRDRTRRVIVCDPEQGYSVVSTSLYDTDETGKRLVDIYTGSRESSAVWKNENGVRVPTQFSFSSSDGSGFTDGFTFDVNWEEINPERIDPHLFTYKSFQGVWDGFMVFDHRGGKIDHIDTIGKPFVKVYPAGHSAEPGPPKPDRRSRMFWLLIANLVIGVGCVYFVLRRKRAASK